MSRRFAETAVGALVLAIAVWFLVFAYNSGDFRPVSGYSLTAKFSSVGGLAPGNDVRIGGVKVGSVLDQRIDPKDFRAVVVFSVRSDLKLPDDTVAAITSDGLLGGKYLRIEPGHGKSMLAAGAALKTTRDALSLEDLLGRAIFLLSEGDKEKDKK
ncbi:MAG: outer membrane lipid asymmetry maintenance protein MlaD [Rhodospirillaceae bacterium]|nr:outer membrane lipid asymmetry maintenance protein MlaD [Rhodospirillaceae bacterium]